MEEDRMPTLFEILNRFSKPPLDLWSFYVYLKEHYGGVEYLEFWLDCAAHTALCKDTAQAILRYKRNSENSGHQSKEDGGGTHGSRPTSIANGKIDGVTDSRSHKKSSSVEHSGHSPSSSVLFDILQDDALGVATYPHRESFLSNYEDQDDFDVNAQPVVPKRFSSLSYERARNKRDTVSRLSEILDNMRMPEYPSATATSPTRNRVVSQEIEFQSAENGYPDMLKFSDYRNPQLEKPSDTKLPDKAAVNGFGKPNLTSSAGTLAQIDRGASHVNYRDADSRMTREISASKRAIRNSAIHIINTYLTPKAPREIELPSDQRGWSMADDIRQLSSIPGGLDSPKIFENATNYVFEALEREALPGFLVHSALSNVQPVSATFRLLTGLLALLGAFWLSFVYVLLDWSPKSHRCWVILPFSIGWYLTVSGLYHIDPLLAMFRFGERDGGGVAKIQEKFVWKVLNKRGLFVLASVSLLTAAFSVLFIFVPGHRL